MAFTVLSDETLIQSFDAAGVSIATIDTPTKAERAAFFKSAPTEAVRIVAMRNRYVQSKKAAVMGSYSGTVLNFATYLRNPAGVWYVDSKREKRMLY